jgi:hypothetical protein
MHLSQGGEFYWPKSEEFCWPVTVLYGTLRQELGRVFRELAQQKESEIEEGHLHVDHVHIRRGPRYSYSDAQ